MSPSELAEKYGNIRFIRPSAQDGKLRSMQHEASENEDFLSYATLPHGRKASLSPETSAERRNFPTMPPLHSSVYNSKLPYE